MKISADNIILRYDNIIYKANNQNMDFGTKIAEKHQDQVIIDSSSYQMEEKKIAADAAACVCIEVRTPTSQDKIESLQQQVREGTYRVDPDEIVSRMLLEKGN